MKLKQIKTKKEGWTFVETLIVMAIVLILTASVGFSAMKQVDKARVVTAKSQMETLSLALDSFCLDMGRYPYESEGFDALFLRSAVISGDESWNGPYVEKKIPKDPWGKNYVYSVPGENGRPYSLKSLGRDGVEGGDGYDEDICL